MTNRIDGRQFDEIREIKIKRRYISHTEGSVFIEAGKTRIICTATVEEKVPPFLKGSGKGWITAEYDMIPRSAPARIIRPQVSGKITGRTHEIQRLIGRALRCGVDLDKLGERTIWIDCDVIEADGSTRTTSITGSFVALFDCMHVMVDKKILDEMPIENFIAAVSVGIVNDKIMVDLNFTEDSAAQVDMNVIMDSSGRFIEIQASAEGYPFYREEFNKMVDLASDAIDNIIAYQKRVLSQGL